LAIEMMVQSRDSPELRPTADVVELPGVGHYPQVEVPDVFTRAALSLLSMAR
jgi:pimeloyl-ACP methyl ester carboxylesterase